MNKQKLEIKLEFITGLSNVVFEEINQFKNINFIHQGKKNIYINFFPDFRQLEKLRSVLKVYLVSKNFKYNPFYISNHKSILGNIISMIIENNTNKFKSFKIICAGSDSPEVKSIAEYIKTTYGLFETDDADMKIHIIKKSNIWEIGIQITPMPLSIRSYKVRNMEGAIDPTVAYALNSLCGLEQANSYLNIFSGSATLLIEAGQCYPNLEKLVGFDNDKENLSLAMKNIKKAGLIKKIELKEEDIFDKPDLGKFDVITSDPPFGMLVSKYEDIEKIYQYFIEYCEEALNIDGILAVYTSRKEIFKKILSKSKFKVIKKLELKFITSANTFLYPNIFICKYKKREK